MPRQNKIDTKTNVTSSTWEPKSRTIQGVKIYCSPACGGSCTLREYKQALALARSVCKELGPDWIEGVHENHGWFPAAIHKTLPARITPFKCEGRIRSYSCDIFAKERQFLASGPTPKKALDTAIKCMIFERDSIDTVLKILKK